MSFALWICNFLNFISHILKIFCVTVHLCVCVCLCVDVRERERERDRQSENIPRTVKGCEI